MIGTEWHNTDGQKVDNLRTEGEKETEPWWSQENKRTNKQKICNGQLFWWKFYVKYYTIICKLSYVNHM